MFQEDFRDAAMIAHNLMYHPLSTASKPQQDLTLLPAALNFNEDGIACSFLGQPMETLPLYFELSDPLMRDLGLLEDEFSCFL